MSQFQSLYPTEVFFRLPEEKQEKIFHSAAAEFARHGFDKANTNVIARRAGISVGSLFQYFRTKQALFLAMVDFGTQMLLAPVIDNAREAGDALALFRYMLHSAGEFAKGYPDYNKVYLMLTAEGTKDMTTQLARRIEEKTIACYRRALKKSTEEMGVKEGCLAFLFDNLVLSYQFSFVSVYYRERLIAYTGLDPLEDSEALYDALCDVAAALL